MISNRPHALVIGAGSAIGEAVTEALIEAGYTTTIAGPDTAVARADASRSSRHCSAAFVDVTRPESCIALMERELKHAKLEVVVNCAAHSSYAPLTEQKFDDWDRTFAVSLQGAMNVLAAVARRLADGAGDRQPMSIVSISSLNGTLPVYGYAAYCAAKAGLEMLTRVAALELAPRARVNAVAPGPVDVPSSFVHSFPAFLDGIRRRHLIAHRLAAPAEVARAVLFLASDSATWITGQTLTLDGGVGLNYGDLPDPKTIENRFAHAPKEELK